jgi:hypothetical protein
VIKLTQEQIKTLEDAFNSLPELISCFFRKEDKCGKEGKYWMEKQPPETKEGFWNRMFNFEL